MPFENFYNESDKARRRWWKCVGAAFLLLVGYWAFALLAIPDPTPYVPPPEKTYLAGTYPYYQIQQRVGDLCASLPLPEDFHLVEKSAPIAYSRHVSNGSVFRSRRTTDEIYPTFIIWFNDNGWQEKENPNEGLEFVKQNQTIEISLTRTTEGVFHGVKCTEWIKD